ncbi:MAG TPA: GGDEF domain-containing protein [Myxococcaceae bacterium]|nr:GGDEF domain-containing protein [Myxococcaceae bacterium]
MTVKAAGALEPDAGVLRELLEGLRKAGVSARALREEGAGPARLGLVVLGPGVPRKAAEARRLRERYPQALVLQAQRRPEKAAHADGALPLPISPADLKVRLPELLQLRALRRAPQPRPGEGILDPLTAFYTFRHFKEVLFVEVKRARRYGFPVALALCAFDRLDEKVRAELFGGLALAVRRSLRDTDYPVQYSPDRVLVLMPHTDLSSAVVVSQRICERVAKASLTFGERVLRPTVSVGLSAAAARGGELSFADLVVQAQGALEQAMASGGNKVEIHDTADDLAAAEAARPQE